MKKLVIYSDPTGINKFEDSQYSFSKLEEYPILYRTVLEMLHGVIPKDKIIVRNLQLEAWTKRINDFMPSHSIEFIELSIRTIIKDSWGIDAPAYLLESDLMDLYNMFPIIKLSDKFEEGIIAHALGVSILSKPYTTLNVFTLGKNANISNYIKILNNKTFAKIITHFTKTVIQSESESPNLVGLFFKNPSDFYKEIVKYKILKNYSSILKKRYVDSQILVELTITDVGLIPISPKDVNFNNKKVIAGIKIELNSLISKILSKEDFINVVHLTSGILEEELVILLSFLKQKPTRNEDDLFEKIISHFQKLLEYDPKYMVRINQLRSPAFPSCPEKINNIDMLKNWAIKEYLPYRNWLDNRNITDTTIDGYGTYFSDWISKNYLEIKLTYPNTLLKLIPNIKAEIETQRMTLLLVIDNLSIQFVDTIVNIMKNNNLTLNVMDSYIAMIPTETKISKTALLSSNMTFDKSEQDYRKIASKNLNYYFNNKNISYITKVSELESSSESNFLIINFLMIDEFMHTDQNKMAKDRAECVIDELKSLFEKIFSFLMTYPDVDIYITSDHGSTKNVNRENNIIDINVIRNKYTDIRDRVIEVNDLELTRSGQLLSKIGYIFEKDTFELDTNYIVAKGYSRFKNTSSDSYVHGGLTPEEIIVPLLHFSRKSHTIEKPKISLENNVFRINVKTEIRLIIENNNQESLNNVKVKLISPFISTEEDVLKQKVINGWTKVEVTFNNVRIIKKGNKTPESIEVLVTFISGNREFEEVISNPIKIKSMQENNFDFDF